jgi:hypothetical protein
MFRQEFVYNTPPPKDRDPRTRLPAEVTVDQRRALHEVLWPTDFSIRFTIRQWLLDGNFACIEQGFSDLTIARARYPAGGQKVTSFVDAADDLVAAKGGMSEAEISDLMKVWHAQYPDSVLAETMWPALLSAAAWVERGNGLAAEVSPEHWRAFRALSKAALVRVNAMSPAARANPLGL